MADSTGLGYKGGALVFTAGLAILAVAYYWTTVSRVFLFWAAFILTRPINLKRSTADESWFEEVMVMVCG
jgi:uncharacterized membrane-anchored protein